MTTAQVLERLQGVKRSGKGHVARCPAHDDRQASLSVGEGDDGRVLVKCFAGCDAHAIASALGIELRDLFADNGTGNGRSASGGNVRRPKRVPAHAQLVATYTYEDADGRPIYYRDRFEWIESGEREKTFSPRQPDGSMRGAPPVPYRLPALLRAIERREPVILVEGEKAADALTSQGYCATTTGGAKGWKQHYAEHFRGAHVVLWPDADEPGEKYIADAAHDLLNVAESVRVLRWPGAPEHWDAADFWQEGGSADQLDALLADAPPYESAEAPQEPAARGDAPVFLTLAELMQKPELLKPPERIAARIAYRARATAVCAPEKAGKSTLMAHLEAAITRRRVFLGEAVSVRTGRVVHVGLEEAVSDAVRRLVELDADPDRVQIVTLSPPDLLQRLRALLAEWPADLVVVDSLTEYARVACGGVPDDGNNAAWADVVRPLVQVARDFDLALVIIHHVRRSDGQYRGGSEIAAAVDCLLEMKNGTSGDEPNLRRITGRARWTVEPFAIALRDGRYELAGGSELSLDARVLLHIERNPGTSKRATRATVGGRASAVDAALGRLVDRGAIEVSGTGYYPPSGQVEMEAQ